MRTKRASAEGSAKLVLETFLPFKIAILSNRIAAQFAEKYGRQHDLSIAEWRVLATVGPAQGITASRIVELTHLEKSQVSRVVSRLLARNLLMRQINDTDRRWQHLYLTPAGLKVYAALVPVELEIERKLLSHLTPEELGAFEAILDRLHTVAEDL